MDHLITNLIELNKAFEGENVPLILGGGMGLYIRSVYGKHQESTRYPFRTEARATADLDIFLTAETIVSKEAIEKVKAILSKQGYAVVPEAQYFQFSKQVTVSGSQRSIRLDFLSAPPAPEDKSKVKISAPRVKPKGVDEFHAYKTDEAEGISIGLEQIDVNGSIIQVVSPFNYLILKLHAFNDRKDETNEKSDRGRHHAWDIFATIVRMNESDWKSAHEHRKAHAQKDYFQNVRRIQGESFLGKDEVGFLRMREHLTYQRDTATYDPHVEKVAEDLRDLFKSET
ncbi:MAG: hypothetical protein IPK04_10195 [Bdellovibrionales bacterium]|nr:hypothetical protein [Bdellovibrionales bacterium]